jgi:antitoxin HicB
MTQPIAYPVDLTLDEDGCTIVAFPDLPEALTGAATRDEALVLAVDCLEEALAGRIVDGEAIPPPSPARGRPRVSACLHTLRPGSAPK